MEYDELICTACSLQFTEDDRVPHMIPQCGHTFCLKCIHEMLNKIPMGDDFICPEDSIPMPLPDRDLSNFPINNILMRLIEKRKFLKGVEQKATPVQTARRCLTKGDDSTLDELAYLKRELSAPRGSSESTNKNSSVSEAGSNREEDNTRTKKEKPITICQQHQRNCEVICVDHKCRICTNCALFGAHKNHEIRLEEDVMKEIASRAEKLVDLFQVMEEDQKAISEQKHVEKFCLKVREKYNEVAQSIKERFNEYINLLKARERKILEEINQKFVTIEQKFKEVKQLPYDLDSKVKKWKSSAQELLVSATEISEKGQIAFALLQERNPSKPDALQTGQKLINDLKAFVQSANKPFDHQLSKITITFSDDFEKSLDKICKLSFPSFETHPESSSSTYEKLLHNTYSNSNKKTLAEKLNGHSLSRHDRLTIGIGTDDNYRNLTEWDIEGHERFQDDDSSPFRSVMDTSPLRSVTITNRRSNKHLLTQLADAFTNYESNKENRPTLNVSPLPREIHTENSPLLANDAAGRFTTMKQPKKRQGLSEAPFESHKTNFGRSVSPIKGNETLNQFNSTTSRRNPSTKLGDKYEIILEGIKRKTLRTADLTGAGMGDSGVLNLVELLKANHTLKSVKLSKNKITDEGGFALVSALYFNTALTTLNLSQNMLTEKTIDAFIELCRIRKTLKTIYLTQNCLGSKNLKQKLKELTKLGVNVYI